MRFRKLPPSALRWFNRSRQTECIHTVCIQCSFSSCVSIHGMHLTQTSQYANIATNICNALNPIFSSIHSSLFVIHWFRQMSRLRCSSFCVTAAHDYPECGLYFMSLSPLLSDSRNKLWSHINLDSIPKWKGILAVTFLSSTKEIMRFQWDSLFEHSIITVHTQKLFC